MAPTPTTPLPPPAPGDTETAPTTTLPEQARFPVLTSGQYRLAPLSMGKTANEKSLHRYQVRVELKCSDPRQSFKTQSYTLMARRFLFALSGVDPQAAILPRVQDARVNKILCNGELPDINAVFERYYAWRVEILSKKVFFNLRMETTHTFYDTFKQGEFFEKLHQESWWVTQVRLETQGKIMDIGYLLRAHNRYTNQTDTLKEIGELLAPAQITDIDITVEQPVLTYYNQDTKTKEKVRTRWLKLRCPVDIAAAAKELLIKKWPELESDKYVHLNIKNFLFVPYDDIFTKSDRISHMAEQNTFLAAHKEITVLSGCDIDSEVTYTQEIGQVFGTHALKGQVHSLRFLLHSWKKDGECLIASLDLDGRSTVSNTYMLLAHKRNASLVRARMGELVTILKGQHQFQKIQVGNSMGIKITRSVESSIKAYSTESKNYLQGLKSKQQFMFRAPTKHSTTQDDQSTMATSTTSDSNNSKMGMDVIIIDDDEDSTSTWKAPPATQRNKKGLKTFQANRMVDYTNQQLLHSYRDVLTTPQQVAQMTQRSSLAQAVGRKTQQMESNTMVQGASAYLQPAHPASLQTQIQEAIKTPQFSAALRQAVLPQVRKEVQDIVTPTVETINGIEKNVDTFRSHISESKAWRDRQQAQLDALKLGVNSIAQGVRQMTDAFAGLSQHTGKRDNNASEEEPQKKRQCSPIKGLDNIGHNSSTGQTTIISQEFNAEANVSTSVNHGTQHNIAGNNQFGETHNPSKFFNPEVTATPAQDDDSMSDGEGP